MVCFLLYIPVFFLSSCSLNAQSSSTVDLPKVEYTSSDPYRNFMNDLTPPGSDVSEWTNGILMYQSSLSFDELVAFYQSKIPTLNIQGSETADLENLRQHNEFPSEALSAENIARSWCFVGEKGAVSVTIGVIEATTGERNVYIYAS